MTLNDLEPQK